MSRYAFFISDGTGITAETLGNSLLSQFGNVTFQCITLPYIDTLERAQAAVEQINQATEQSGEQSIVIDTIVDQDIRAIIDTSNAFQIDIFATFLSPLERELDVKSSYTVGGSHSSADSEQYVSRIDAVNFALDNDDGGRTRQYEEADVILVGVSRSGKTPTCLYLAMQFGIKAANYPLTEEDMGDLSLPAVLKPHASKLFGLTIDPDRLSAIRTERKANSRYASLKQCYQEIDEVEMLYQRLNIPNLSTTDKSIEEISTRIMAMSGLKRRLQS